MFFNYFYFFIVIFIFNIYYFLIHFDITELICFHYNEFEVYCVINRPYFKTVDRWNGY